MNEFFIEKADFKEIYGIILHQYKVGYLPLLDMSKMAVMANKYGFELDYNFGIIGESKVKKQNNCIKE